MDNNKTELKKAEKFLFIVSVIGILLTFTISFIANAINSPILNNLFAGIFSGLFGIIWYVSIVRTTNIKEILSAFFVDTLAVFLLISMLNNVILKLLGFIFIVIFLTPLIVSIIFDSKTENVKMKIIRYIVTFILALLLALFILH